MGALDDVGAVVREALSGGDLPVVVLDVDSTLFDTGERHRRILLDYAHTVGDEALRAVVRGLSSDDFGWTVHGPLEARGVGDAALYAEIEAFWFERFFSDAYADLDLPTPGAAAFVRQLVEDGAFVAYLTGRVAGAMAGATLRLLQQHGFPCLDGRTMMVLKQDAAQADAAYKAEALARLRRLGRVVATFENEPGHANHFLEAFPDGVHVWLDTVHSPDAPPLAAGVHPLTDFRR